MTTSRMKMLKGALQNDTTLSKIIFISISFGKMTQSLMTLIKISFGVMLYIIIIQKGT